MSQLNARVESGRLVLDEPTTLPDGTILDLVLDDEGGDLSDKDREVCTRHSRGRGSRSMRGGFGLGRKWSAPVRERLADAGIRFVQTPFQAPNAKDYASYCTSLV